ncbi:hypothetical protein GF357_04710 [Candidatus Dojkabacteria bacterium]|nr:hypothetical protein [Candidatus Dojkabacteria bacterium]
MLKIATAVKQILEADETAQESIRRGFLNFSAYAKEIKPQVELLTRKPVKKGSIVVALSRLEDKIQKKPPLKPQIELIDISVKSPLTDITFERTSRSIKKLAKLENLRADRNIFMAVTQGVDEITIIYSSEIEDKINEITKKFKPKARFDGLASITVQFSADYIDIPNVLFTLISALAYKRINIIEIVSAYSELTFVIRKSDLTNTLQVLQNYLA